MSTEKQHSEDTLSKLIGQFGKWQFIVFATVALVKMSSGWVQMAIVFLTPNLENFWCVEFQENSTIEVINSTCYEDCIKYEYDTSPFDNTIISEWDLICGRSWLASFTQTLLQTGILIGSIVFGFLSDRYGRKPTFLISITLLIIIGLVTPFSPNYTIFTVLRFFIGIVTAGTMVISFVIIIEVIGPKYREVLGCIFHLPFILAHMSIPLFAYYFKTWNSYSLALAVPPLIYLVYFVFLHESPKWLLSVGRVEEATIIVKKAVKMNKLPSSDVEETLTKYSAELMSNSKSSVKINYTALLRKSLRLNTICICFAWFVTGLMFYGFNQYIGQTSSNPFISVAAAGFIQIPSNIISIWLMKWFGRKYVIVFFFFLGGVCIITLGLVPDKFWITFSLGTMGVSCTAVVAVTVYIYTSELYPTVVRNMGVGACSTSMRVGSMIAPFVSNLTISWLPTIVFGCMGILAALVCVLLPETKGQPLLDSLNDLDKV